MKIIKFPDRNSAKAVKQEWHAYLKPLFKSEEGRNFKQDGELFNRHLGKDHETSTIIEFRFRDDLNGHYLTHPEEWDTWPYRWIKDLITMIPEGLEITERIEPEIEDEI